MSAMLRQMEMGFQVRAYEVGPDGKLPVYRLLDYFQEAAARHADQMDISYREMLERGLGWVLARLHVRIEELPSIHEEVVFTTWHSGLDKRFARRCFEVTRPTGEVLVQGTTNWVVFDAKARTMIPVPQWIARAFEDTRPPLMDFPSRSVPKLAEAQVGGAVTARHEDLDANGHVNTSRLVAWLFEPLAAHAPGRLAGLDVAFRHEARAGDEVGSDCAPDGEGTWSHVLRRMGDGSELVRARTFWT